MNSGNSLGVGRRIDWDSVRRIAQVVRVFLDARLRRQSNCPAIGVEEDSQLKPAEDFSTGSWHY
jgi:hypothetical protein